MYIFLSNIRNGWFSLMMTTIRVSVVKGPVFHDDVIKSKYFPCYWPFVRGIHRSSVNSPHKGQWRGALMFSLFCAWTNAWVNNRDAGDLKGHLAHVGVTVMLRILVLMVMVDNSILPVCYFFLHIPLGWYWHMMMTVWGSFVKVTGTTDDVVFMNLPNMWITVSCVNFL